MNTLRIVHILNADGGAGGSIRGGADVSAKASANAHSIALRTGQELSICAWLRTRRDSKNITFLELNDGSCLSNLQAVIDRDTFGRAGTADIGGTSAETAAGANGGALDLSTLSTGASLRVTGVLHESPASGQKFELHCTSVQVIGTADPSYPMQKKRHSFEYLREIAHLRPRTNTFGAIARLRNVISCSIHAFFQENGFIWLHSPILTGSDAEGAGDMFRVTRSGQSAGVDTNGRSVSGQQTAQSPNTSASEDSAQSADTGERSGSGAGAVQSADTSTETNNEFFGKPAYLTVSGQLNAEIYATAMERVYTFGPTFRAENSNTSRHLAEFWMIEPEMAFCDISCNMDWAERFLRFVLSDVLEKAREDMEFFDLRIQRGIIEQIARVCESTFLRMSYSDAVRELEKSVKAGRKFEYPVSWGVDLQSEHERFLCEELAGGPLILTDYPKGIKAFYMRLNDDEKTVRAMDVLVPRLGEIIGGSEREERLSVLERRIGEAGLSAEEYWWYLDLRRYGTVPHSGFGLGLERLIQYVSGMQNIRDVIPFPRTPRSIDF